MKFTYSSVSFSNWLSVSTGCLDMKSAILFLPGIWTIRYLYGLSRRPHRSIRAGGLALFMVNVDELDCFVVCDEVKLFAEQVDVEFLAAMHHRERLTFNLQVLPPAFGQ